MARRRGGVPGFRWLVLPAADLLRAGQRSIERHWTEARKIQRTGPVAPTRAQVGDARARADAWVAAFQQAEAAAIRRGDDVQGDAALQALLREADQAIGEGDDGLRTSSGGAWALGAGLAAGAILLLLRRVRRSR